MTSRKLTCKGEMVEKSDASGAFYILKSIMYLGSKTNMLPEYVKNRLLNCLNVDFDYDRTVGVNVDYSTMCDVVSRNKEVVIKAIKGLSE